jgi:hypothetical protein
MSGPSYQSPTFRNIVIGIALSLILFVVVIGRLPQIVKIVGLPLMVIPSSLGLVQNVAPADVQHMNLAESEGVLEIARPGRYALYTADWDLLELTETSMQQHNEPWLAVTAQGSGGPVPVTYVERGLRPYDTPFAPGRPVYSFVVPNWGVYTIKHPRKPAQVAFVPDYTTGRERELALFMTAEVLVIVLPFAVILGWRYARRRAERRSAQEDKRRAADAFWERRSQGTRRR